MKYRNKILLAIWGVVLVLLLITSVTIRYWVGVQVEARFAEDLRSNYATLRELNVLRGAELSNSSKIIAETPRLKAVVELGDRNTALQLSLELNRSIVSDLFILYDAHGRTLVQLVEGKRVAPAQGPSGLPETDSAAAPVVDVRAIDSAIYRYAATPILVGPDRVGTLVIGFKLGRRDLDAIKVMTNSDVVLARGNKPENSTLSPDAETALEKWIVGAFVPVNYDSSSAEPPLAFTVIQSSTEKYLAAIIPLSDIRNRSEMAIRLIIIKSVDKEVAATLRPVFTTFIIISVIILMITAAIGYIISQGITRPIAALVRGTTEISQGNYDYLISVGKDTELKYLGEKFKEMSRALKEKMGELAERNVKLEEALQQLRETQEELVKSERLAATGKLTGHLAHEINNPVHNIQSCLQSLSKRLNVVSTMTMEKELLDVALEEITRLSKLTRQLLDVYRTSMVPIDRGLIELNKIIGDVLASSAETLKEKRIAVKLSLHPSLPTIEGSADKLKQVFLNLFLNAKDAMTRGGTLTVESFKQNGNVIVTVADTGIGIAPSNINRIFDAFFTTKSKVSGVGLGLSVTYGIIRQHGGTIAVKSKEGEGAMFTLVFPIRNY